MTLEVVEDTNTEEALAAGLLGVDASRRVGWAKAFEALRRVDAMEEENRQLRDELRALRRAYSRLVAFVQNLPGKKSDAFNTEVHNHGAAERLFRHQDAWDSGRKVADEHRIAVYGMTDDQASLWKDKKTARKIRSAVLFKELRIAGEDSGHKTSMRALKIGATAWCECGAKFRDDSEHTVFGWRHAHLAETLYGLSFEEYWQDAKRRYDEEVSRG